MPSTDKIFHFAKWGLPHSGRFSVTAREAAIRDATGAMRHADRGGSLGYIEWEVSLDAPPGRQSERDVQQVTEFTAISCNKAAASS